MGGRQSAIEIHQWRSGASPKGPEGAVLGEFYLICDFGHSDRVQTLETSKLAYQKRSIPQKT